MNRFNRWIRTKQGLVAIAGTVAIALIAAVAGQQLGWWGGAGTAGLATPPQVSFPLPTANGGYTCMPSCAANDGKFLIQAYGTLAGFGGTKQMLWVAVGGDQPSFKLGFFDGDNGLDNSGNPNAAGGNWDANTVEATFTLYADPLKDGAGRVVVKTWKGNADKLPNNAWIDYDLENNSEARGPSGHYFYRLEIDNPAAPDGSGDGFDLYKVRSTGYLSAGSGSSLGLIGGGALKNDWPLLNTGFADADNPGVSNYTGSWQFYLYVPAAPTKLEIWDGDFDRGSGPAQDPDTDDPNTQGKPAWAGPFTRDEGAGGTGNPADDSPIPAYRRSPAVIYSLTDPEGQVYLNDDPSGTEEWENFVLSANQADNPDLVVSRLQSGFYLLTIDGLDAKNAVWLHTNYPLCDPDSRCGPPVWGEGVCPRTVGYWKNNFNWVYNLNRTVSVQESQGTLDWALRNIALASPIFRSGLNLSRPAAGANPTALTPQEANIILQRDQNNYPGEAKPYLADWQSLQARALQQDLAAWLNLATGKISPAAWVVVNAPSGAFEGTLIDALYTVDGIISSGGSLEYAKDIVDTINNGQINVDPESNLDLAGEPICTLYDQVLPADRQPPVLDKMPQAAASLDQLTAAPAPEAPQCTVGNAYNVENTASAPFNSLKFTFAAGAEVKDGGSDVFQYNLLKPAAASIAQMQVQAKTAADDRTLILSCDFTSPVGCDPLYDLDHKFGLQFLGAAENPDGTLTLKFQVWVFTGQGLSQVAFELPSGLTASEMGGAYTSQNCTAP